MRNVRHAIPMRVAIFIDGPPPGMRRRQAPVHLDDHYYGRGWFVHIGHGVGKIDLSRERGLKNLLISGSGVASPRIDREEAGEATLSLRISLPASASQRYRLRQR